MKQDPSLSKIHILAIAAGVLLVGVFFWSTFNTFAFVGPTANPPTGNGAVNSDASNNVYIGGNLNVTGTISSAGGLGGSAISAGNVSNGQFGSNVFGGNYSFPGSLGVGTSTFSGKLTVDGVSGGNISLYSGPSAGNFSASGQSYLNGWGGTPAGNIFTSNNNNNVGAVLGIDESINPVGIYGAAGANAAGGSAYGFGADGYSVAAAGTVNTVEGGWAEAGNLGAGTVTNMVALATGDMGNTGGGTVVYNYGIEVNPLTSGTNIYAIYTNQPSSTNSYAYYGDDAARSFFGGNVGIGMDNSSFALAVAGSSTAAAYCISGANCITAWPAGSSGANPTGQVGTSAVNGSATTFMRSDGAPAINTAATFSFSALGNTTSTANISAATLNVTGGAQTGSSITAPTKIGACASTTVTITGATSSTGAVFVSPLTYPGNGYTWQGYVSALNTVVVEECAATTTTGSAVKFNAIYIK